MRNLSDTFIPRVEFRDIKDALLGKRPKTIALTGSGMKAAMQGMGGIGKTVIAIALAHDKEIRTLKGHSAWVRSVKMTQDGKTAISASYDKTINLWDLETGKNLATFSGEGVILCVAISPDGKKPVAGEESISSRSFSEQLKFIISLTQSNI